MLQVRNFINSKQEKQSRMLRNEYKAQTHTKIQKKRKKRKKKHTQSIEQENIKPTKR